MYPISFCPYSSLFLRVLLYTALVLYLQPFTSSPCCVCGLCTVVFLVFRRFPLLPFNIIYYYIPFFLSPSFSPCMCVFVLHWSCFVSSAIHQLTMSACLFGVVFAPLWLPLRRRLQTAAVAFWLGSFLLMGVVFCLFLLYLLMCTRYWYVSVAYAVWLWCDLDICNRGGRRFVDATLSFLILHYMVKFKLCGNCSSTAL